MCGIFGLIDKAGKANGKLIIDSTTIIKHRGPDDEGYLTWVPGEQPCLWAGIETSVGSKVQHDLPELPSDTRFKVGFGHRRLSILDLSPAGHQPMLYQHLSISFNGEVYNYLEVKQELETMGHQFKTGTDTEVILQAWAQWGPQALHKFNGMFSFLLLDAKHKKMYAVRDRFGVKPLYYSNTSGYIAFASEVKQLRLLPGYQFKLNEQIAYDYLRYGHIDHQTETFEIGLEQVAPGYYHEVDLEKDVVKKVQWYELKPQAWKGTEADAFEDFKYLLKDSVKLRMRSDVPVGSALSGGLDSSTIICLMRQVLEDQDLPHNKIETVTSCSEDKKYDEWEFAEEVIKYARCNSHRVFPSFEKLKEDFEKMLWHMDYPFGSTSQFSQWCVFEGAKNAGLTVMIDGQGADEQLAGYGGNDIPLYSGLLRSGNFRKLLNEAKAYRESSKAWPKSFLLGAVQTQLPGAVQRMIPGKYNALKQPAPSWLNSKGFKTNGAPANSLLQNLMMQVNLAPLPALLRYEDRNSMAFSVESRTPFMDYRLMEFTLGLPENLVYKMGERKFILRQAFKGDVPDKILERKDKMGFVSAEERWMNVEGKEWFSKQISSSSKDYNELISFKAAEQYLVKMQQQKTEFNFEPWRIICFNNWVLKRTSETGI
jgi:asparagine synthase (glutamine-hydrolysing)